jgi:hypothetical protein
VSAEPWVDPKLMVLIGSIGGGVVGLWGAAIGTAGSFLVPRGKGKALVMTALVAGVGVGVLALLFALAALAAGQPYAVWYPCLPLGVLLSVLGTVFAIIIHNRYRQVELRRMQADELN